MFDRGLEKFRGGEKKKKRERKIKERKKKKNERKKQQADTVCMLSFKIQKRDTRE